MAHALARGLGDEQHVPAALGHPLQARGRVGGVADRGVLDALLGADVAGHHRTAVSPTPIAKAVVVALLGQPRVEALQARPDHLARRRHRSIGVIGLLERRSEHAP